ncbi:ESX secretion-associated protein EspG [Mycobacterium sp. ACS4331]|uniref:ESX secretion-associated protein EspG n=1 Tax=Mycobacterium sp. ACS4331 TaxID=1834121 RepID=UPI000800DD99|nr:ESX secretion-associated protein EspG [Mycobacterium sp. ACS4331]OBF16352.1 secretion protein EspG [Mycobacterium sp. ACS4331]
MAPNAVELTVEAAWFIADTVGAGTFPWVLAITPPYRDGSERAAFVARQTEHLTRLGVMTDGGIDPAVEQWIRVVCHPQRWLELRFVGRGSEATDLLRGIVACRDGRIVVALRNAHLVTFTAVDIADPHGLVPVVTVGLSNRRPASFDEFAMPARVGARADEQLRRGAELSSVMEYLGIPESAHAVVQAVFAGARSYVEIVAGQRRDATQNTSEVGVAIFDTTEGRVLVSPTRAYDGEWVSTFTPGTPFAIALALQNLTATLPDGQWFPSANLARDFTTLKS